MEASLPEALLARFSECLGARMGLQFTKDRWADLERGIGRAAPGLGFADPAECIRWLLSAELNRTEIEALASHLTVGEAYFFREPRSFEALERQILPEPIRARPARRAGAATGGSSAATAKGPDRGSRAWTARGV